MTWASKWKMVHAIHLSQIMRNLYFSVSHKEPKTKIVTGERKYLFNSKVSQLIFFRFDGSNFSSSKSSTYSHEQVLGLGNYRGQPFTTGGGGSDQAGETEILTIATDTWRSGTRFPYSNQ